PNGPAARRRGGRRDADRRRPDVPASSRAAVRSMDWTVTAQRPVRAAAADRVRQKNNGAARRAAALHGRADARSAQRHRSVRRYPSSRPHLQEFLLSDGAAQRTDSPADVAVVIPTAAELARQSFWDAAHRPVHGLLFVLPLVVLYEAAILSMHMGW